MTVENEKPTLWKSLVEDLEYCLVAVLVGIGFVYIGKSLDYFARLDNRKPAGLQLKIEDINGNGIPEKFYSIDGKIALIEIDGKPVSEFYKK